MRLPLNLVEIEKKIGAAGSYCMDQSYFRMLLLLVRKSKQPGFFKSEKSLGLKECNLCLPPSMSIFEDVRSRDS